MLNNPVVVAGVGTGGTLLGVAEALRRVYPDAKAVAVEPAGSAVMSAGQRASSHSPRFPRRCAFCSSGNPSLAKAINCLHRPYHDSANRLL